MNIPEEHNDGFSNGVGLFPVSYGCSGAASDPKLFLRAYVVNKEMGYAFKANDHDLVTLCTFKQIN